MKLKVKNFKYSRPEDRINLVSYLSRVISYSKDFQPYMPDNEDNYWTLDSGNNWKIFFEKSDDYETFHLTYRYSSCNPDYERALLGWLKVKMFGLELVEE